MIKLLFMKLASKAGFQSRVMFNFQDVWDHLLTLRWSWIKTCLMIGKQFSNPTENNVFSFEPIFFLTL